MKRGVIFGIFIILLVSFIGFISSVPYILFVDPTPVDGYSTTSSGEFEINISLNEVDSLNELIWNWDSVNYSLYDEDLVLMYNFENNSLIGENDTKVVDVSKYGNNGSVVGGNNISVGKFGYGRNFIFDNQSIIISDKEEFKSENFTVSLWYNKTKTNFKEITTFGHTTCIILESGEAYCLGSSQYGQLGDGTLEDKVYLSKVLGGHNFSSFARTGYANEFSTCAILTNGSAMCWGENDYGQLGNGNTTNMNTPQYVLGGHNFSSIYLGRYHVCGLLHNGSAMCWGYNSYGGLGMGNGNNTHMRTPQFVAGGYNFSSISAETFSSCGILQNGSVLCWGRNNYGQLALGGTALGVANTTTMYSPTPILGNYTFKAIQAHSLYSYCGLLINGSAMCWGGNANGQLGLGGGNVTVMYSPTPILGNYNFSSIFANYYSFGGILQNGSAMCWGSNQGQLGIGNTTDMFFPTPILGEINFSYIRGASQHSCGVTPSKEIYCWGRDSNGKIGKGFISISFNLPILFKHGNISSSSYSIISTGVYFSCGLLENGSAMCWGDNKYGQLGIGNTTNMYAPTPVLGGYNFSSISSGYYHVCGLLENGNAMCWGDNRYGELGNGSVGESYTPQPVLGEYNFSSLFLGYSDTCGLLHNRSLLCWGRNNYGQLGIGNTTNMYTPTPVLGGYNFSSISSGSYSVYALLQNGSAMCWGDNRYGQLGIGNTTNMYTPTPVLGGYNFSSISSGSYSVYALLQNGSAMSWGYNNNGQLGIGNATNMYTPQYVLGGYNFSSISSGTYSSCGVLQNGSVMCWGYNSYGELGIGNNTDMDTPTLVKISYPINKTYSKGYFNIGILSDGRIVVWGYNAAGELGYPEVNTTFPTKGFYKGTLIGKDINYFKIDSTFQGNIRIFTSGRFQDLDINEGWNNILLSYNGTTANIYLNGELNSSFENYLFEYPSYLIDLLIGKDSNAQIDEVRVYNRSLSASEVQQVYRTNLMKKNMTSWEFYANESLSSGDKTYTYGLFGLSGGTTFSLLRNIIKYTLSIEEEEEYSGTSSGGSPSRNSFKRGFSTNVMENSTINIPIGDTSNTVVIIIKNINPDTDKITLSINDTDYEIPLNETSKIDLNHDGYYDIEIFNRKNYGKVSNLEFKSIHEAVPAQEQEEVSEEVTEEQENNENNEIDSEFENKVIWFRGFITGVAIIIFVVIILLTHVKRKKKKRYKKFGY